MLEREGAKCTEEEIGQLGKSYTDFISSVVAPIVEEETGKQGHPSKQGKAEENAAKQGNGKGKGNKEAKETDKGYLQGKTDVQSSEQAPMSQDSYVFQKPGKEKLNQAISQIGVEQKQEMQAKTQFDEASVSQQQLILELQKKESIIQHNLKEKEAAIQEKEYAIQEKETAIRAREAITQNYKSEILEKEQELAREKREKDAIINQIIQEKKAAIEEREAIIQQKDSIMQRFAEEKREKENEEAKMRKTKKKWREISPEIEEIFKSNFFTSTKNENWKYPEDFEIIESISEGRGAFNVGVFKVSSKIVNCAIKIIERMVEDTPESVQPMYNTLQIRKLDQSETSIPFAFAFPTMVPLLNFFIGDLKSKIG